MARGPRPKADESKFQLDPHPTGEAEAREFENADDRAKRKQAIDLVREKKGLIGRVTGSTNEQLNTGLLVFLTTLISLAFVHFFSSSAASSSGLEDALVKLLVLVLGYVFGTSTK